MFVSVAFLLVSGLATAATLHVSNLDITCIQCLCSAATRCDLNYDCSPEEFCGPFFISKAYWETAGRIARNPSKAASSDGGYKDCVKNFQCATKVVTNFMAETAWDCNGDGVTDCDDYASIHFLGPKRCHETIENTPFHSRYTLCRPIKVAEDLSLLDRK